MLLPWKRKKDVAELESASVGVLVGPEEAHVVHCDRDDDDRPVVLAWEVFPVASPADLQAGLARFVDAHRLRGASCRATLASSYYSLRLVERPPNVPDAELADATRWLIRDLVEFDVEQSELAILTIPEDGPRARTPKMFVIATQPEVGLDLAHAIDGSGLRLLGFETVETTLLAIDERLPDVVAGSAMIRLDDKSSLMTVVHEGRLFLVRNLHVDLAELDDAAQRALGAPDPTGPEVMEALDPLLLDVQRSLDYYESEYGQAPASRLAILPSRIDASPVVPALAEAFRPMQVESIDVEAILDTRASVPEDLRPTLLLAAGATLVHSDLVGNALLPARLREASSGLGLASVVRVVAAIAVVLATYWGLSIVRLDRVSAELASLEARRDALQDEIDTHREQAALAASSVDPEAEIEALTTRRDARVSMLRDMTQRSSRSDASFGSLLGALARQDTDGVWLERIEFSRGGDAITLEGRSLSPDAVPGYLRGLGTEPGFAARRFRSFSMERGDDAMPGLRFRLATLDTATEDEEGRP